MSVTAKNILFVLYLVSKNFIHLITTVLQKKKWIGNCNIQHLERYHPWNYPKKPFFQSRKEGCWNYFLARMITRNEKKIYGCASIFLLLSIPFLEQKICTLFKTNSLHLFVLKIILLVFLVEVFLRQEQTPNWASFFRGGEKFVSTKRVAGAERDQLTNFVYGRIPRGSRVWVQC